MQQRFFYLNIKKWINYRGVALLLFLAQVKNWSKIKNMNNGIEVVQVYYATPYHELGLFMISGSCLFLIWFVSLSRYFGWVSPPFKNDATCLQVLYRYMYIKIGSNNRNVHLIYLHILHQVVFYHVLL